jgi:hypothetical protein
VQSKNPDRKQPVIKTISEQIPMMEIDLRGPDGNAQALIVYARKIGRTIGLNRDEIEEVVREMTKGSYANLIQVFEQNFGEYVILFRSALDSGC